MMRIRPLALFVAIACLFTLSACGPDYSTPEATAQQFAKSMNSEDMDAAADCFVAAESEEARKKWTEANEKRKAENKEIKAEVIFKKIEKDGDWTIAVMEMKDKESGKGREWKLAMVEENGQWKLSDAKSDEYRKKQFENALKEE